MDKEIKICPRCEQGYLYHARPKYFNEEIILCDECYAMWLGNMKIFYGEYGKDFYDYHEFMDDKGVPEINMWEGEFFVHPYYENENPSN
jgi:hypothetical protein